jgi:hypothetical protein
MAGTTLVYEWMKSHQDDRVPWQQLSLEAQQNKTCDDLANNAVTQALANADPTRVKTFLLPFERLAIISN